MLRYVVSGVPYGCIYALVGLGLVITYRVSGVFNFAFGAQAYVSAAVFYETAGTHGWPVWAAAVVSIGLVGVAGGLLLDRILFRFTRTAPTLVKLVVSLGLLVAIPALLQATWLGTGSQLAPPSVGPSPARFWRWHSLQVDSNQLAVIVATVVITMAIGVMFRATATGLRMRAVVESPRLAQLVGVDAGRVGALAWVLSSVLAGIAGVLIAPIYRSVDTTNFDVLVVAAMAAAVVGRLSSLTLTVLGGLLLGIGQELVTGYLPLGNQLVRGLRPSLPFALLLVGLLLWPGLSRRRALADPLSAVDPPPEPPETAETEQRQRLSGAGLVALLVVAAAVLVGALPEYWLYISTEAVAMGVVFLSFTVLVGMSGQLSLCQAEFAGAGAFVAGQLAAHYDMSVIAGLVVGGALAAALGLVAALPALRMGGMYLALATFAFALLIDNLVFSQSWAGGGAGGMIVPRPLVGPVSFDATRPFFVLAAAVFALCALAVSRLRRGTTGQYFAAIRGSELAAESIGINAGRAKIVAFVVSAAIAGVGGALLGSTLGAVSPNNFTFYQSLFWLVIVVITGVRSTGGALAAGLALVMIPQALDLLPERFSPLLYILFGFGAISFIRHQEGLVAWGRRLLGDAVERRVGPGDEPRVEGAVEGAGGR